jgi:hypothetical protein
LGAVAVMLCERLAARIRSGYVHAVRHSSATGSRGTSLRESMPSGR